VPASLGRDALQFNSLGSHDTGRIRFTCGGDMGLNRMAAVLLFTYLGTPCVYYGEEIGLGDAASQEKRQPMPWEESAWDMELRAFYQKLIALRKQSSALIEGGFQVLLAEDRTFAFLRDSQQELLISVAFRGPGERAAFRAAGGTRCGAGWIGVRGIVQREAGTRGERHPAAAGNERWWSSLAGLVIIFLYRRERRERRVFSACPAVKFTFYI
jgi:glycosidase